MSPIRAVGEVAAGVAIIAVCAFLIYAQSHLWANLIAVAGYALVLLGCRDCSRADWKEYQDGRDD